MRHSSDLSHRIRVNLTVEYIQGHLDEPLTVETLACIACLSPHHFHRVFLSTTGLTPAEYVEYARMNAVVEALRTTRQTVTTIAATVGFESGAALAKAMRRRYGLAPSSLRDLNAILEPAAPLDIRAFCRPKRQSRLTPRYANVPRQWTLCAIELGMKNNQSLAAHGLAIERVEREIERQNLASQIAAQIVFLPDAPKGPNDSDFRTIAGYVVKDRPMPRPATSGTQLELIGGRYAIFSHQAPLSTVWQSWFAIHHGWLPTTSVRRRDQAPFQITRDFAKNIPDQQFAAEIFIPIE